MTTRPTTEAVADPRNTGVFRLAGLSLGRLAELGLLSLALEELAEAAKNGSIDSGAGYEPNETPEEKKEAEERGLVAALVHIAADIVKATSPSAAQDQDPVLVAELAAGLATGKAPSIGLKIPSGFRGGLGLRMPGSSSVSDLNYADIKDTLRSAEVTLAEVKANLSTLVTADTPRVGLKLPPGTPGLGSFAKFSDDPEPLAKGDPSGLGLRATPELVRSWTAPVMGNLPDTATGPEHDPGFQRMMRGLTDGMGLVRSAEDLRIGLKFNGITAIDDVSSEPPEKKETGPGSPVAVRLKVDALVPALN